jgi:hypothetical protein
LSSAALTGRGLAGAAACRAWATPVAAVRPAAQQASVTRRTADRRSVEGEKGIGEPPAENG